MREERRRKQGGGHKREIRRDFEEGGISRAGNNTLFIWIHTRTHTHIDFTDVLVDWLWSRPQHKHYAEE